jgi:hypothetical protein
MPFLANGLSKTNIKPCGRFRQQKVLDLHLELRLRLRPCGSQLLFRPCIRELSLVMVDEVD